MKTKSVLGLIMVTVIFMGNIVSAEGDKSAMDESAERIKGYIKGKTQHLKHLKEYFDKEDVMYDGYNDKISRLIDSEIEIMEKMVSAAEDGDQEEFEKLEREQEKVAHDKNVTSLEKDMFMTLNRLKEKSAQYPESDEVNSNIDDIEENYADMIKAEKDAFNANRKFRKLQKKISEGVNECNIYFSEIDLKELQESSN